MKKFNQKSFIPMQEDEIKFIHGVFKPMEIYTSEKMFAVLEAIDNVKLKVKNNYLQIYRISPLGVELEFNSDFTNLFQLKLGSVIDIVVTYGNVTNRYVGLTIVKLNKEGEKNLIGIKWIQDTQPRIENEVERRAKKRWICGPDFLPTGIAANPALFNDYIFFKVRDFSKEGLQLTTSLRNKFIIPEMILESTITFPMVGQVQVPLKVEHCRIVSIDGKDYLAIGVTMISESSYVSKILGQYALQFVADTNVSSLKEQGLIVQKASSSFDFSYVKTVEDYYEVLRLRLQAYSAVGKMDSKSEIEIAGDIFDTRARILMVKHHGKLVGSVRSMFHELNDKMEHEQFVALPKNFPAKHEIVEVTRVCTDKDYRGSDLLYSIMKYVFLIAAQGNKRWILGCATDKLIPVYEKMGFKKMPIEFTHKDLGNEKHTLLLADVPKVLCGSNVSPHIWKMMYSDLLGYLNHNHGFKISPSENLKVGIYKFLSPLTKALSVTSHYKK